MTKWTRIATLACAIAAVPGLVAAQTVQPTLQPPISVEGRMMIEQGAQAGGRGRAIASVETRVTPNRPYSAEAVTESLQVLGDGNRISKRSVTRVHRDSEGRTRREQLGDNGLARTISINDPIGGAGYTLDPATKTAFQTGALSIRSPTLVTGHGPGAGSGTGSGGGRGGSGVAPTPTTSSAARVTAEQATAARVEQAETSRSASAQAKQVVELAASGNGKTTREELGEQTIEGVRATGTRSTTVIPAGSSLGNLNEIRIVSEQWFSPDLEVLVLTKHSDPRVGETIYKLVNIVRGQPDPNLFVVPPDYKVQGRTVRNQQ